MKTLKGYVRFLRRQSKHMQHVHAFVFAGGITVMIAGFILYTDYGFWHERYQRDDDILVVSTTTEPVTVKSPGEMFSQFLQDARNQLKSASTAGSSLFEGKETYTKESGTTTPEDKNSQE